MITGRGVYSPLGCDWPSFASAVREGAVAQAAPFPGASTNDPVFCYLLSDAAAFISGDCIRVDGAAPLATGTWPMPEHERSRPFEGFHRAKLPDVLK